MDRRSFAALELLEEEVNVLLVRVGRRAAEETVAEVAELPRGFAAKRRRPDNEVKWLAARFAPARHPGERVPTGVLRARVVEETAKTAETPFDFGALPPFSPVFDYPGKHDILRGEFAFLNSFCQAGWPEQV
ncbi:hypothetical protein EPN90_02365 [Patescibacteria group bacterium]|nr:MAG: hypothetical protein EPN90_02365 [Patescibacteria group bacterium]